MNRQPRAFWYFAALAASALLSLAAGGRANADSLVLNSGSSVTYLSSGTSTGDFSSPFTSAQFSAAQTGPNASVLALTGNSTYISALPDGPGAVWIGTNVNAGNVTPLGTGDTALYAISFDLPSNVSAASLNLYYAVDDSLGLNNAGIYINGVALPGSTGIPCAGISGCGTGDYASEHEYVDADITSLLTPGTNWLYIDAVNQLLTGGIMFSADITYTPVATPEPSSIFLLGAGLLSLAIMAFVSKRRANTGAIPA